MSNILTFALTLIFTATLPALAGPRGSVGDLVNLGSEQEREQQRLSGMEAALPWLTHEQLASFAVRLASDLNDVLKEVSSTSDEAVRKELWAEARTILETVLLVSRRLDPLDKIESRMREFERQIERRRIPVRLLFGAASFINTLADMTKGRIPDFLGAVEDARLERVKLTRDDWRELQSRNFIATFKKQLGGRGATLEIMPGVGGATKSEQHLRALVEGSACEKLLSK